MSYVVLDTDVASLSLKRRLPAPLLAQLIGRQACITFVTLAELTQWAELRQWGPSRRHQLQGWLDTLVVLPYDEHVAQTWGRISAAAIRRGRRPPANDTWVAASCISHGLPLATRNVKDFEDFARHELLSLVTG